MEPLVPAEVDLRDFGFMPLDVRRLLTSETWIEAADEPKVGHAAMCLWAESWHQVPAASLPDNDRVLARLAMCTAKEWKDLRDKIMAGWVKCSDGLLYHPVVAEKALESWKAKAARRARTKAATEAREARKREEVGQRYDQRHEERNVQRDVERNEERNVHQGTVKGQGQGQGEVKQEQSSLRSDSTSPADDTDEPGPIGEAGNVHQHPADRVSVVVLAAYHDLLPNCRRIAVLNPKRRKRIQLADKLAKQVCRSQGWDYDAEAFWRAYFGQCLLDPWLRGDVANPRNPDWKQNLDVLLAEDRFAQIMDRAISRMEAAA